MTTRRRFLSFLGIGGAGLALGVPEVKARGFKAQPVKATRNTFLTPTFMAKEVAREMRKALGGHRTEYRPDHAGARLQFHVSTEKPLPTMTTDEFRRRYAEPVGQILAAQIKQSGIRVLTNLSMPQGGADAVLITSASSGIALRQVIQHDIKLDRDVMRFDILGAAA